MALHCIALHRGGRGGRYEACSAAEFGNLVRGRNGPFVITHPRLWELHQAPMRGKLLCNQRSPPLGLHREISKSTFPHTSGGASEKRFPVGTVLRGVTPALRFFGGQQEAEPEPHGIRPPSYRIVLSPDAISSKFRPHPTSGPPRQPCSVVCTH